MKTKLYTIYKGTDKGTSAEIKENFVGQYSSLEAALTVYEQVKKTCKEQSMQPKNLKTRVFCYMTETDLSQPLIGVKDGKTIDHGFMSRTLYANNFTQTPKAHPYMINKENGVDYDYRTILQNHWN